MTIIWKIFFQESTTLKCTWKICQCYCSENVLIETSTKTSWINCSKSSKIHARRSAEFLALTISSFTLKKQMKWITFSLIMTYTQSMKMFLVNQFTLWTERILRLYLSATSMLVTDVEEEMCWWQLKDVGDGLGYFGHEHHLYLKISVGCQHPKDSAKLSILSRTF